MAVVWPSAGRVVCLARDSLSKVISTAVSLLYVLFNNSLSGVSVCVTANTTRRRTASRAVEGRRRTLITRPRECTACYIKRLPPADGISTGTTFMWTILRSLCMMSWRPLTAGHQSTRPQPVTLFAPQFPVCLCAHILVASIGIQGSGLCVSSSVCQVAGQEPRYLSYAMQGNMHIVDDGPSRSRWRTADAAHTEHWTRFPFTVGIHTAYGA